MVVDVLKVDVLSSPSLMSICGLGSMPESRQREGGQVDWFHLWSSARPDSSVYLSDRRLLRLERKHLNTLISHHLILSVDVPVARSLCWSWKKSFHRRSALSRGCCLCSPDRNKQFCHQSGLRLCLKWLPLQTILSSVLNVLLEDLIFRRTWLCGI